MTGRRASELQLNKRQANCAVVRLTQVARPMSKTRMKNQTGERPVWRLEAGAASYEEVGLHADMVALAIEDHDDFCYDRAHAECRLVIDSEKNIRNGVGPEMWR